MINKSILFTSLAILTACSGTNTLDGHRNEILPDEQECIIALKVSANLPPMGYTILAEESGWLFRTTESGESVLAVCGEHNCEAAAQTFKNEWEANERERIIDTKLTNVGLPMSKSIETKCVCDPNIVNAVKQKTTKQ